MCNGFGMIVDKTAAAYFTAPNRDGDISHSDILKALGWKDNTDAHLRHFVRVECADWTMKSFRFDEQDTLPGWVDEADIRTLVAKALGKTSPAWVEYDKVRAKAWVEYDKVRAPAWVECDKVTAKAWAEYDKVRASALKRLVARLSKIKGYVS